MCCLVITPYDHVNHSLHICWSLRWRIREFVSPSPDRVPPFTLVINISATFHNSDVSNLCDGARWYFTPDCDALHIIATTSIPSTARRICSSVTQWLFLGVDIGICSHSHPPPSPPFVPLYSSTLFPRSSLAPSVPLHTLVSHPQCTHRAAAITVF